MSSKEPSVSKQPRKPRRKANGLGGKQWIQNSISVWSDIRKTAEEARFKHPAMFPEMLVRRLIETFLPPEGRTVLDPFAGSGSTLLAAQKLGKDAVGFEISPEYVTLANDRIHAQRPDDDVPLGKVELVHAPAAELRRHLEDNSIDLCITSPPYWDILNRRRTADFKQIRHYGNLDHDLGTIANYEDYLDSLAAVCADVLCVLKPGAYCCVIVMDLRKKSRFYPLHSDLASRASAAGYLYDDLIVWNRQAEYNNLRPLGFPSVFRVNKVHEFIVLLRKPA